MGIERGGTVIICVICRDEFHVHSSELFGNQNRKNVWETNNTCKPEVGKPFGRRPLRIIGVNVGIILR
jgi:hypothetical protein